MDLFDLNNNEYAAKPLAEKMRASNLDDFIGQKHIVSPNSLLRRAISMDRLGSCIFWGPPGCGKTTLAHIIASTTNGNFVKLNAVQSGVADVKKAVEEARNSLKMYGKKTYLLLDECHRFNKTQSDSLLPSIEQGTIIFIGSTTENPYASMTPAIVSRCRVFEFKRLSEEEITGALKTALTSRKGLYQYKTDVSEDALKHIANMCGGDLRAAYNALELAVVTTQPQSDGTVRVTLEDAEQSIQRKALSYSEKKDANKMKRKSNRRGRRQRGYRGLLWVLAAGLLLFGLIAQQNILLGTSSQHALLMDARTGQVLARKRSGEEAAPASLTKMMTVLLATEALPDLDTPVTLPEDIFPALYKADASMAGFQPGETVTVRDLLYGAMLPSGAECCEALARQVSGSEEAFVALMNRKAGELGMKHTHFANCTGLTSPEHYSSAADLAVLLQAALNNETFRTVFTTGQYTSSVTAQHPKGLYMASTLLSRLDGGEVTGGQILGGKTGYTDAAGLCLASLAVVNGKEYILVTLGAPGNHATEQTNIMDAVQVYRRLEKKK